MAAAVVEENHKVKAAGRMVMVVVRMVMVAVRMVMAAEQTVVVIAGAAAGRMTEVAAEKREARLVATELAFAPGIVAQPEFAKMAGLGYGMKGVAVADSCPRTG